MENKQNWKMPIYLLGSIFGLIFGFLAAHLYTQSVEENHGATRPKVETGDLFRLGMSGITLMRQITDLGAKGTQRR